MILEYRKLKFELSQSDYDTWLEHLNYERLKGNIIEGSCPFCDVFLTSNKNGFDDCGNCQLMIFGVHEGDHRVYGYANLLIDILGDPFPSQIKKWGFFIVKEGILVYNKTGIESLKKIRNTIINSVVDKSDRNGVENIL